MKPSKVPMEINSFKDIPEPKLPKSSNNYYVLNSLNITPKLQEYIIQNNLIVIAIFSGNRRRHALTTRKDLEYILNDERNKHLGLLEYVMYPTKVYIDIDDKGLTDDKKELLHNRLQDLLNTMTDYNIKYNVLRRGETNSYHIILNDYVLQPDKDKNVWKTDPLLHFLINKYNDDELSLIDINVYKQTNQLFSLFNQQKNIFGNTNVEVFTCIGGTGEDTFDNNIITCNRNREYFSTNELDLPTPVNLEQSFIDTSGKIKKKRGRKTPDKNNAEIQETEFKTHIRNTTILGNRIFILENMTPQEKIHIINNPSKSSGVYLQHSDINCIMKMVKNKITFEDFYNWYKTKQDSITKHQKKLLEWNKETPFEADSFDNFIVNLFPKNIFKTQRELDIYNHIQGYNFPYGIDLTKHKHTIIPDRYYNSKSIKKKCVNIMTSMMGTGKSKATQEHFITMKKKNCLIILPRRTLIEKFKEDLPEFIYYNDLDRIEKSSNQYNKVLVCLPSILQLKRYYETNKFDVVFIDEFHQLISFFLSKDCFLDKNVIDTMRMFLQICREAETLIIADGQFSSEAIWFIDTYIFNNQKQLHFINITPSEEYRRHIKVFEYRKFPQNKQIQTNEPIFNTMYHTISNYIKSHNTTDNYPTMFIQCPYLNCKIKSINRLVEYFKKTFKDIKILVYSSQNNNTTSDVDTEWVNYDIVISTQKITTGISFNIRDFFQKIIIFCENGKTSYLDALQFSYRIRHLKNDLEPIEFHIFHTANEVIRQSACNWSRWEINTMDRDNTDIMIDKLRFDVLCQKDIRLIEKLCEINRYKYTHIKDIPLDRKFDFSLDIDLTEEEINEINNEHDYSFRYYIRNKNILNIVMETIHIDPSLIQTERGKVFCEDIRHLKRLHNKLKWSVSKCIDWQNFYSGMSKRYLTTYYKKCIEFCENRNDLFYTNVSHKFIATENSIPSPTKYITNDIKTRRKLKQDYGIIIKPTDDLNDDEFRFLIIRMLEQELGQELLEEKENNIQLNDFFYKFICIYHDYEKNKCDDEIETDEFLQSVCKDIFFLSDYDESYFENYMTIFNSIGTKHNPNLFN